MKKLNIILFTLVLLSSCREEQTKASDNTSDVIILSAAAEDENPEKTELPAEIPAINTYHNYPILTDPLTNEYSGDRLEAGEAIINIGETQVLDDLDYTRIRYRSDKEGWMMSYFIINEAYPAVSIGDIIRYSNPQITAVRGGDKNIIPRGIVLAVEEEEGQFLKVHWAEAVSRGRYARTDYIKKDAALSSASVDIGMAIMLISARESNDPTTKKLLLNEAIKSFADSQLIEDAQALQLE